MDESGQCAKAGSENAALIVLTSFGVSWLGYERRHSDSGDELQSAVRLAQEEKRDRLSPNIESILSRGSVPASRRTSETTLPFISGTLIRLTESNETLSDLTRCTTRMTAEATARAALQEAISRRSVACARTWEYSDPCLRGWLEYYAKFRLAAMLRVCRMFQNILVKWAKNKYKGLKRSWHKAFLFMANVAKKQPRLFAHWERGWCLNG